MAILFELVSLALKPLVLAKLSCQIGARIVCIVFQTWVDVLRFAVSLHLTILWRVTVWAIAALSLPVRAFTALCRERKLEMQLYRLKNELENVLWDREEVEDKLWAAIKELKTMEMMLMELEEEHDEAIVKIEMLEGEIQRLKEVHGKVLSSYNILDHKTANNLAKTPSKSGHYEKTTIIQMSKDPRADKVEIPEKTGSRNYNHTQIYSALTISNQGGILAAKRDVALYQSLFSAVLSLTVGLVMWEAGNPCMPLVVALFTVVSMSLASAVRLFGGIENKPASDVVALVSLNWFVLGTISCPMLPKIARFFAPLTSSFMRYVLTWAGL